MKKLFLLCLLLTGCGAARKLPDPSRQNVWMCHPPDGDKPNCAQVDPSASIPKESKCKTIPQTGGSELVVCEKH